MEIAGIASASANSPTRRGQPLVSVIMNCFNGERYLREAIDSVYAQTYGHWEIIFVDNGSTDGSALIAKQYDSRLRYVRNPATVPLGQSRNIAVTHSQGDYIAFLDCDDLWEPLKLERQMPRFENPRVGLVCSNCRLVRDGRLLGLRYSSSRDYAVGACLDKLIANYFIVLSTAVIRRSLLLQMEEWFDPALHVAEEADLFVRMAVKGDVAVVDEALATYRLHSTSDTVRKGELFLIEIEKILCKLERLVPAFRDTYGAEARRWLDTGYWASGVAAWRSGSGRLAREAIRATSRRSTKHYVLYLASLFPYRLCRGALEFSRKWTRVVW